MKQTDLLEEAGIELERRPPPVKMVECEECGEEFPRGRVKSYPDVYHEPGRRKTYMYLCRECEQAMQSWVDENLPGIYQRIEEEVASHTGEN